MAAQSSLFCLGNPMDRGAWQATVHGGRRRVGHNLVTEQRQPQSFTAALVTIASSGNQPKCPQTNEWIKKMYKYTSITQPQKGKKLGHL